MKLYTPNPMTPCCGVIRAVADFVGQKITVQVVDEAFRKTPEFKLMNSTDTFPILETAEGCLQESSAIVKYLCQLSNKGLGTNATERSLIDQWFAYTNTTIRGNLNTVLTGIFGTGEVTQAAWNEAAKNLKAHCKVLNTALEGKTYLASNEVTCADILLACALM